MVLNFGWVLGLMDFFYHESARIFTNVVDDGGWGCCLRRFGPRTALNSRNRVGGAELGLVGAFKPSLTKSLSLAKLQVCLVTLKMWMRAIW